MVWVFAVHYVCRLMELVLRCGLPCFNVRKGYWGCYISDHRLCCELFFVCFVFSCFVDSGFLGWFVSPVFRRYLFYGVLYFAQWYGGGGIVCVFFTFFFALAVLSAFMSWSG